MEKTDENKTKIKKQEENKKYGNRLKKRNQKKRHSLSYNICTLMPLIKL